MLENPGSATLFSCQIMANRAKHVRGLRDVCRCRSSLGMSCSRRCCTASSSRSFGRFPGPQACNNAKSSTITGIASVLLSSAQVSSIFQQSGRVEGTLRVAHTIVCHTKQKKPQMLQELPDVIVLSLHALCCGVRNDSWRSQLNSCKHTSKHNMLHNR